MNLGGNKSSAFDGYSNVPLSAHSVPPVPPLTTVTPLTNAVAEKVSPGSDGSEDVLDSHNRCSAPRTLRGQYSHASAAKAEFAATSVNLVDVTSDTTDVMAAKPAKIKKKSEVIIYSEYFISFVGLM